MDGELTGPELNLLGVKQLVEADINKKEFNNTKELPKQGNTVLELNMSDDELIKLSDKWETKYNEYYSKIKKKQEQNKVGWMGKNTEGDNNMQTNLIFEAESTMAPQALGQNPEPVTYCATGKDNDEKARAIKVMLQYHADVLNLRPKLGKMLLHWDIYYIAAMKHGFDASINDIKSDVVYPTNLIFDVEGYVDENMDFIGKYVGEKKSISVGGLIDKYPEKKAAITVLSSGEMDTNVTYTEWWTDDYMFVTYGNIILEKSKNPHFNYEGEGENHFAAPCKPYSFLVVFSLGNQPHDNTSLIEQAIPNQTRITKRVQQIDKNISYANNSIALHGKAFNEDQAKQAANAREMGDPILVPDTAASIGEVIQTLPAATFPTDAFNELEITKGDLRSSFGTAGSTPIQNDSDRTVRGKILDRNLDTTRIGTISEALERVANNVFNWWTQLYYVYYDEPHYASIMGGNKAVEYVEISKQTMDTRVVVSVAPNSMRPRDELTEQNFYTDLFNSGKLDPLTFFEKVDDPDPLETSKRVTLWMTNPQAYTAIYFPENAPAMQQGGQENGGPEMGIPADQSTLQAPPSTADISQIPLNQA